MNRAAILLYYWVNDSMNRCSIAGDEECRYYTKRERDNDTIKHSYPAVVER